MSIIFTIKNSKYWIWNIYFNEMQLLYSVLTFGFGYDAIIQIYICPTADMKYLCEFQGDDVSECILYGYASGGWGGI